MNSKGLEVAGLTAASKNPEGGVIRRKKGSDEPDGGLEEAAFFGSLGKVFGKLGSAENVAILKAGTELYASFGYTTAQEGRATPDIVATMAATANKGGLKIDVVAHPDIIGGAKLSLDSSPQGRTAWMTKPCFKMLTEF